MQTETSSRPHWRPTPLLHGLRGPRGSKLASQAQLRRELVHDLSHLFHEMAACRQFRVGKFVERGIEVPIMPWPHQPKRVLRVSAQLYNSIDDYEKLADALGELLPHF